MNVNQSQKERQLALYAAKEQESKYRLLFERAQRYTRYWELKLKHPEAVILFKVGDFYECYGQDARVAADILGITVSHSVGDMTVTGRELYTGFPYQALDIYLPKLVRAGERVVIEEAVEKTD